MGSQAAIDLIGSLVVFGWLMLMALTANTAPIDGIALLHFPSRDAFAQRFYDSDAGRDALLADTQRFLDVSRCEAALMSEYGVQPRAMGARSASAT